MQRPPPRRHQAGASNTLQPAPTRSQQPTDAPLCRLHRAGSSSRALARAADAYKRNLLSKGGAHHERAADPLTPDANATHGSLVNKQETSQRWASDQGMGGLLSAACGQGLYDMPTAPITPEVVFAPHADAPQVQQMQQPQTQLATFSPFLAAPVAVLARGRTPLAQAAQLTTYPSTALSDRPRTAREQIWLLRDSLDKLDIAGGKVCCKVRSFSPVVPASYTAVGAEPHKADCSWCD